MRGVCEAVRIDCWREMMGNGESGAKRGVEIALAKDVDELTDRALMRCASCPIALYRFHSLSSTPSTISFYFFFRESPFRLCLFPPTHSHTPFFFALFLPSPPLCIFLDALYSGHISPCVSSIRQRSRVGAAWRFETQAIRPQKPLPASDLTTNISVVDAASQTHRSD